MDFSNKRVKNMKLDYMFWFSPLGFSKLSFYTFTKGSASSISFKLKPFTGYFEG
jgi:hypothetical protein